MSEKEIEQEIQEKSIAPRVSLDEICALVVDEQYHVFDGTVTTVCCLTLKNGFSVIGQSAPVSWDNFDSEIGKEIAKSNAIQKIWPLEVYLLRERLYKGGNTR